MYSFEAEAGERADAYEVANWQCGKGVSVSDFQPRALETSAQFEFGVASAPTRLTSDGANFPPKYLHMLHATSTIISMFSKEK